MAPPQTIRWIDTETSLAELVGGLRSTARLAVDTEANGFHAYRPRLCLIQLAWETEAGIQVALVDPLQLRHPSEALGPLLADVAREKILHGADYDVRLLSRDAGIALGGLFDTEMAARLLGLPRTGLATLSATFADVTLSKAEQRLDWAQRPLPAAALHYAAQDVAVLFAIRDALAGQLDERARRHWADEEFRRLERVRAAPPAAPEPLQLLARAKGVGRIDDRTRTVLAELLVWREREAERRDVPAVHIIDPVFLQRIAAAQPRSAADLAGCKIPPRTLARHGEALLAAVERGLAAPPLPRPALAAKRPADVERRLKTVKSVRDGYVGALGLEGGVLAPSALLERIAVMRPRSVEDLLTLGAARWQVEVWGEAVLEKLNSGGTAVTGENSG